MDSGDLFVIDKLTQEVSYTIEKAHEYQTWAVLNDPFQDCILGIYHFYRYCVFRG